MTVEPLKPEALRHRCDATQFEFETSAELAELTEAIGQQRAMEALRFGLAVRHPGYNIFALGPSGMGKHYVVRQFLEQAAAARAVPQDWCYVHAFDEVHQPRALALPPGKGVTLRADMERLIEDIKVAISAAFEGDEYQAQRRAVEEFLKERQQSVIAGIEVEAAEQGIGLLRSPGGLALVPLEEGEVMRQEVFESLGEEERAAFEAVMETFRERLHEALQQAPQWEREQRERIREINREVATVAIAHLVEEMSAAYEALPQVLAYLGGVFEDIVRNAARLAEGLEDDEAPPNMPAALMEQGPERHYKVNVIVDHAESVGAPVVYEDQPTVYNLVGRLEHRARMGALMTDFTLIRAGALHRANGGYLLIDAIKLLEQPHAWQQLKAALRAGEIRTRSLEQLLDRVTTVTLEPSPIPLDLKVVLIGERHVYAALAAQDPDFEQLFKVAADFDEAMSRTEENVQLYARLLATLARKGELRPLNPEAVARVIERVGRLAHDNQKLSIHIQSTSDLLREADHYAGLHEGEVIGAEHIEQAIQARMRRHSRVQERTQEDMSRAVVHVATEGQAVGQVNGLSVLAFGQVAFGRPSRITATAGPGKGGVVDIEREVDLGGPLHSKGVLILTGFLGSRCARTVPLALSARVAMEQSYGGVDGDSATMAETCALVSALTHLPLRQDLALTGSMDQFGRIQAVGGVNEKIEGFYDLCVARGLTGTQGVLLPAANVHHLMLRQDLVDAAAQGRFHVYLVDHIDQALELLMGHPAGQQDPQGHWTEDSINARLQRRLGELAELARAL